MTVVYSVPLNYDATQYVAPICLLLEECATKVFGINHRDQFYEQHLHHQNPY